jgi:hypothetical protein
MSKSTNRVISIILFLASMVVICFITSRDSLLPFVASQPHFFSTPLLHEPTSKEIHYCQSWFLAGLLVNAISIVAAIWGLVFGKDRRTLFAVALGFLLLLNLFALFLVRYHNSVIPTIVTLILFFVYAVSDMRGIYSAKKQGLSTKPFKIPATLDIPSFLVTAFLAYYTMRPDITIEFAAGATAGLLLTTNLVYIAMSGLIFEE